MDKTKNVFKCRVWTVNLRRYVFQTHNCSSLCNIAIVVLQVTYRLWWSSRVMYKGTSTYPANDQSMYTPFTCNKQVSVSVRYILWGLNKRLLCTIARSIITCQLTPLNTTSTITLACNNYGYTHGGPESKLPSFCHNCWKYRPIFRRQKCSLILPSFLIQCQPHIRKKGISITYRIVLWHLCQI